MANVKITEKDGRVIEVSEISFDEIRQLVSPANGNGRSRRSSGSTFKIGQTSKTQPEYANFKAAVSDKAQKFFRVLHANPKGISADLLCEELGFNSANQIGGVTGGGIGKQAPKFHVDPDDLYRVEVTRDNGERRVVYRPGPDIEKVL